MMYSRSMSRQEVQGKEGEDIGRVPGEKVEVHQLTTERDDGDKEEIRNEGCKVSFGGEVYSLGLGWRREVGFLQCCKRTTERISGIYKQRMESRTRQSNSKRFVWMEPARLQSILFFLQVHT